MDRSRVLALAVALMCGTALWSGEARGELPSIAGSVQGAEADVTSSGALTAGIGWPSTFARYDFAAAGRFGIGLQGDLYWGHPAFGWRRGFGFGFDVPMRIQVMDRRQWAIAIALAPGFFVGFDDHWYYDAWWEDRNEDVVVYGPRFGAGLIVSVQPVDFLNIFFGIKGGVDIMIVDPEQRSSWVDVIVPIRPFGGIELSVHRRIAIFASLSLGPAISIQSFCRRWDRSGDCDDWGSDVDPHISGHFFTGATFFFGR